MEASGRFVYRVTLPDGEQRSIMVSIDPERMECTEPAPRAESWTALDFHQCEGCPLDPAMQLLCPLAAHLSPVVAEIGALLSYDQLDVEIEWGHRHLTGKTTAQQIASSLIGLISATSGCPKTAFLRPMAWFHLPLATTEETIFRAVSTHLLAQYFAAHQGLNPDWSLDTLKQQYRELHSVNMAMAVRLRQACTQDAMVNAVVVLDMLAKFVPFEVDDSLESLKPLFIHPA
jgi:hypothetical protein